MYDTDKFVLGHLLNHTNFTISNAVLKRFNKNESLSLSNLYKLVNTSYNIKSIS